MSDKGLKKRVATTAAAAAGANTTKTQRASTTQEDLDQVDDSKQGYYLRDTFTKVVVLVASIVLVQIAPSPPVDVIKPETTSFFWLFLSGKLDHVPFITQMFVAALSSLWFDIGVVSYHLSYPPHPKYVMLLSRKISIYLHLTSGITEILSAVVAFTVSNHEWQRYAATIMSIASITHALTAYYQTTVVFGAKGVMVPGYLYAITIHITNAFRLFHEPSSLLNLMITFLALHIYVWCRFFIYFFRVLGAFNGYHYTIGVALSGALLFPYAMGPVGNFNFLFVCAIYGLLQVYFVGTKTRTLFVEHERYALVTAESAAQWKEDVAAAGGAENANDDKARAQDVFNHYDTSKDGKLDKQEVDQMVRRLGIPSDNVKKILQSANFEKSGNTAFIGFDDFYRYIWNFALVKDRLSTISKEAIAPKSDKEKAKTIFDKLDLDQNGTISVSELEMLLTQWGMPDGEAALVLAKYSTDKKTISFDTFHKNLAPVWQFGVAEVVGDPARQGDVQT